MTVFKERVRELRPLYAPVDPSSRTSYRPGERAQCDLLAFASPATVTDVLRQGLPRRTPHTITSALHFTRALERARQEGVATEVEEMHVGYLAVGAPILNAESLPAAAVSATAPLHNTRIEHLGRPGPGRRGQNPVGAALRLRLSPPYEIIA